MSQGLVLTSTSIDGTQADQKHDDIVIVVEEKLSLEENRDSDNIADVEQQQKQDSEPKSEQDEQEGGALLVDLPKKKEKEKKKKRRERIRLSFTKLITRGTKSKQKKKMMMMMTKKQTSPVPEEPSLSAPSSPNATSLTSVEDKDEDDSSSYCSSDDSSSDVELNVDMLPPDRQRHQQRFWREEEEEEKTHELHKFLQRRKSFDRFSSSMKDIREQSTHLGDGYVDGNGGCGKHLLPNLGRSLSEGRSSGCGPSMKQNRVSCGASNTSWPARGVGVEIDSKDDERERDERLGGGGGGDGVDKSLQKQPPSTRRGENGLYYKSPQEAQQASSRNQKTTTFSRKTRITSTTSNQIMVSSPGDLSSNSRREESSGQAKPDPTTGEHRFDCMSVVMSPTETSNLNTTTLKNESMMSSNSWFSCGSLQYLSTFDGGCNGNVRRGDYATSVDKNFCATTSTAAANNANGSNTNSTTGGCPVVPISHQEGKMEMKEEEEKAEAAPVNDPPLLSKLLIKELLYNKTTIVQQADELTKTLEHTHEKAMTHIRALKRFVV